jgi:hypothetical protein
MQTPLTECSDASTPGKQTEQILAVTPILRGQKATEKNPIPPPRTRSESYTSTKVLAKQPDPHPADEQGDLIDFGQNENHSPGTSADLQPAQMHNNGHPQQDLEATLRSTSQPPRTDSPLIDFHEDVKKSLPSSGLTLRRQDTDSHSVDEFVDAQE